MKEIKKGIVFSEDIKKILEGVNAFDYKYDKMPSKEIIDLTRDDFKKQTNSIFNNQVTIVTEEEMEKVNELIGGEYPHCYSR